MQDIIAIYKQVERTLWHLIAIAERGREGIVVFDLNRVIQFVNVAWAVMHGYKTTDELIGKQISAFHTEEQMASDVVPFIEETEQRGQFAGRLGHVRRDGTPFFTEMLMVVFNDDAGRAMGLVGFAADITEQERKADELRQYRCHTEELIKQQTEALEAADSKLQSQVTEHKQTEQKLKQQTAKLSAINEQLQNQITERERAEQHLKRQTAELTAANEQLQDQIAEHEQAGQELRQQTAELSAANERLREQIGEQERAKDELEQRCDKLEQRLREQSDELTTIGAQLQDEITKRKKEGEYFKQQTDAIKAAGEQLRTQIDELSTRGPVDESDTLKATDSVKAAVSITDDEKAVLENVFRQNVVLQRPKLGSTAREDS
ncbi:MAG: PAS domain-containing protein [Planctomycetota bacterium]|jgi:PAS domain S-box-containing protein